MTRPSLKESPETKALNARTIALAAAGVRPPCAPPWGGEGSPWLSERPEIREWAAKQCTRCPALAECKAAGRREEFGVWGAVDRTPRRRRSEEDDRTEGTDHAA